MECLCLHVQTLYILVKIQLEHFFQLQCNDLCCFSHLIQYLDFRKLQIDKWYSNFGWLALEILLFLNHLLTLSFKKWKDKFENLRDKQDGEYLRHYKSYTESDLAWKNPIGIQALHLDTQTQYYTKLSTKFIMLFNTHSTVRFTYIKNIYQKNFLYF